MSALLLGLAPPHACPICEVNPIPLSEIPGAEYLAECARCGFPFAIRNENGDLLPRAVPAVSLSLISIFRRYREETGHKLGLLAVPVDPDFLPPDYRARMGYMDEWLKKHAGLLAGAAGGATWPYAAVTLLRADLKGRPVWQVISPPGQEPTQIPIPIPPDNLPLGAIVTISVPMEPEHQPERLADGSFAIESDDDDRPPEAA